MNSLVSYRTESGSESLDDGEIKGRARALVVLPDAVCLMDLASDGSVSIEIIRIGDQEWNRFRDGPWEHREVERPIVIESKNAEGSAGLQGSRGSLPTDITLAGEELIEGRQAWIISYQYGYSTFEGPADAFVKLWIDQETYRVLKRETTSNDPLSSNSVGRTVYRDFNDGGVVSEPDTSFAPGDPTPTPPC
jgi:hypothetical protein